MLSSQEVSKEKSNMAFMCLAYNRWSFSTLEFALVD
jgi:hypothetical protein